MVENDLKIISGETIHKIVVLAGNIFDHPSIYSRILANSHYGEETVTEIVTFKPGMRFYCPLGEIRHQKRHFNIHFDPFSPF